MQTKISVFLLQLCTHSAPDKKGRLTIACCVQLSKSNYHHVMHIIHNFEMITTNDNNVLASIKPRLIEKGFETGKNRLSQLSFFLNCIFHYFLDDVFVFLLFSNYCYHIKTSFMLYFSVSFNFEYGTISFNSTELYLNLYFLFEKETCTLSGFT